MRILAIDTSTQILSVALSDDNKIIGKFHASEQARHLSGLIPAVDVVLKEAGLVLEDVDVIALSIGPGSFTGLRIGVATCKAISLAIDIPLISVPTLDVIAHNFIDEKEHILCPVLDAKKNKVYACFYKCVKGNRLRRITDYLLTDIEDVLNRVKKPTVFFGDAVNLYRDKFKSIPGAILSVRDWHPNAEFVALQGYDKAIAGRFIKADKLVPMYLHSMYCQVKNK